jgi:hypothetical protein
MPFPTHLRRICSVTVLSQSLILNSAKIVGDMVDKKGSVYSDRQTLQMAGELQILFSYYLTAVVSLSIVDRSIGSLHHEAVPAHRKAGVSFIARCVVGSSSLTPFLQYRIKHAVVGELSLKLRPLCYIFRWRPLFLLGNARFLCLR